MSVIVETAHPTESVPAAAAPRHGGDLADARALFPGAPEPWLDLSTGINPVPYPCPPIPASALRRLPSAADLAALKQVAARAYGAPSPAHIVAAPGTQILIETLPRLRPASRVAVVGPTYAEHAAAWARAGHRVALVAHAEAAAEADVAVVVSPNNPDGRLLEPSLRRDLAARLSRRGGLLVIDAAFADLEPASETVLAGEAGVLVLRSFGKSYGLAGVRLGFALAELDLARALSATLGPWAVSGPAIMAGRAALADSAWRARAAVARARDAGRLDRMLRRAGGRIVGGTVLFRTAAFADGLGLFHRLGEAGIYVRRFPERPGWIRFGLPGDRAEWCRLSRALKTRDHLRRCLPAVQCLLAP